MKNVKNNLPTAAEARARIIKIDNILVANQWDEISDAIHSAINNGRESVSCLKLLKPNRERLEDMGYSCQYQQYEPNGYEWVISW